MREDYQLRLRKPTMKYREEVIKLCLSTACAYGNVRTRIWIGASSFYSQFSASGSWLDVVLLTPYKLLSSLCQHQTFRFLILTAGLDGTLWFTEALQGGRQEFGHITSQGKVTEFTKPNIDPQWMTTGPDGALWFTNGDGIGRITAQGKVTEFSLPHGYSDAWRITAGPDGALWFTEGNAGKIGRITTQGQITEFPLSDLTPATLRG